ncbi:MAG: glycosyltransferase [Gammaproteobacteria bacterium]|nr:glycosyltransferase [Gammaproteobacteria bacterium]
MQTARSGFAEPPLITVVVLTHNRCDELMNTLDRLQGLPEKPEIIVVDNASTDDTARRLAERNPPVRVIRRRNNAGAAGRNDGVVAAHTPFVAFADDDSWWEAGAFRSAISFLQAYPRVGLLCAELRLSGHGDVDPTCREMAQSPLRTAGLPQPEILGFLACAVIIRVEAFLEVGGFEQRFFVGGEEELMAIDLAAAGWQLVYLDAIRAWHRPSRIRDRAGRHRTVTRNAVWTAWMRLPVGEALHRTKRLLMTGDLAGTRLQTIVETVRGLPWALRQRRRPHPRVEAMRRQIGLSQSTAGKRSNVAE